MLFARWASDLETVRYLQWRPHTDVQQTEEFVQTCLKAWEKGEKFYFVARTHAGEPVGFASLRVEEGCRAILGFLVFTAQRGQGYAPELVTTLTEWALSQPGIWRVHGLCDLENKASARTMEKAGFRREGIWQRWAIHPNLGSEPRDVLCYVRIKS